MEQQTQDNRYTAFISYRHNTRDIAIAEKLIAELETFTIPSHELREKTGKKKLGRVFRDKNELPLAGDLEEALKSALRKSDWLIILCCPDFTESKYCMRELTYFIECHGANNVIPVITEGLPKDVIPSVMMQPGPEGTVKEPLAMIVSGDTEKERIKKLKAEKLRMAARMLNVNYDDLYRRFHRRRMRMVVSASAAAFAIVALFAAGAVYSAVQIDKQRTIAVEQEAIAVEQRAIAIEEEIQLLVQRSLSDAGNSDKLEAIQKAQEAYTKYTNFVSNENAETAEQIRQALSASVYSQAYEPVQNIHNSGRLLRGFCYSPDNKYILCISGSGTVLIDAFSGNIIADNACPSEVFDIQFSPSGKYYLAAEYITNRISVYETETPNRAAAELILPDTSVQAALTGASFLSDETVLISKSDGFGASLQTWKITEDRTEIIADSGLLQGSMLTVGAVVSPDREMAVCPADFVSDTLPVIDIKNGTRLNYPMPIQLGGSVFAFSNDGKLLAGAFMGTVIVWDTEKRDYLYYIETTGTDVANLVFSPDSLMLAVSSYDGTKLIRVSDGQIVSTLTQFNPAVGYIEQDAAFSPDSKEIIVYGGTLSAFSLPDCNLISDFGGQIGLAVSFSGDGKYLAISSVSGSAAIYAAAASATAKTEETGYTPLYVYPDWFENIGSNSGMLYRIHSYDKSIYPGLEVYTNSPSGKYNAVTYPDGYVEVWDTENPDGYSMALLREHYGAIIQTRLTDEYLLTSGYDGRLMIFDLTGNKVKHFISVGERIPRFEISKRGDLVIVLTESLERAFVYEIGSGNLIYRLSVSPGDKFTDIGFTEDGSCAAVIESGIVVSGEIYSGIAPLLERAEQALHGS